MAFNAKRVIWHHTADSYGGPQFKKIDRFHKSRKFPISSLGFYVGYHWLIERDGIVKRARTAYEIGAHDQGENLNSLGIGIAGDFNVQLPTEKQAVAAAVLVKGIIKKYRIKIYDFEPHRLDDTTNCPGKLMADNWLIDNYLKRQKDPPTFVFRYLGKRLGLL